LGAPPLVTTTTRRPLVGVPRALFLPLPAMLEGMRITARSCVSRGRGRVNKRKVLAPAKKSCRRISTCWHTGGASVTGCRAKRLKNRGLKK
jgi:hypothetical protein